MSQPSIHLSGFADEAANEKTLDQQFSVFAALGMRYFSIRFVDAGQGIKNVMGLSPGEIETVKQKMEAYGLAVSSLGSPLGKAKLCDIEDGTESPYRPFDQYLQDEVPRACDLANDFGAKLIRGFSFYPPKGSSVEDYFSQATDQVGQIAEVCERHGQTYGLEVEANLVGQNGELLARMHQQINQPSLVLIFDGGNLVTSGYSTDEVFEQYQLMKPGLGWLHIKDFLNPVVRNKSDYVDEDALKHYVPADRGDSGYARILKDFAGYLPELEPRMAARGLSGVFLDLEPHVKGGGQFGGFSGPDGFGVAFRALCGLCEEAGIGYSLRDFGDIQDDRGF